MKEGFTDYQILVLSVAAFMDFLIASIFMVFCYSFLKFPDFRKGLFQGAQNGDGIFHWVDIKNSAYLIAGFVCAVFTMHLALIFAFGKMFETGPMFFLGGFVSVTFALFGIAWKGKSIDKT